MNTRSLLAFALVALAGCTASPEQPEYYLPTALSLPIHLVDAPAPGESRPYLVVDLDPIPYCSPGAVDAGDGFDPPTVPASVGQALFDPGAPFQRVRFSSSTGMGFPCDGGGLPGVRFFRPSATLQGEPFATGTWLAQGQDVVWSQWSSTLALFGPDGPKVSLTPGYAVLRTTCENGRLAVVVDTADRVIELHRAGRGVELRGRSGLEREQTELLATCGIHPPALDSGARVGLDTPRTLRWSPDGSRLYYLLGDAPVRLRSLPATGGATAELAVGLMSGVMTVPASGDVYVMDSQPGLLRGLPQPDGTLRLQPVPDGFTMVSPDGRWIAGAPPMREGSQVAIYDVMTGQTGEIDAGSPITWSPDSKRLAYQQQSVDGSPPGGTIKLWNVDSGQTVVVGQSWRVEWLPGGQLLVGILETSASAPDRSTGPNEIIRVFGPGEAPLGEFPFSAPDGAHVWVSDRLVRTTGLPWPLQTIGTMVGVQASAGLAVEDPGIGARRTVIPSDQMRLSQLEQDGTVVVSDGVVLVWMRQCLGFYQTVCTNQLHRLSLADGGDQVVAVSKDVTAFALSPDHRQVAIGTRDGIFVKNLP